MHSLLLHMELFHCYLIRPLKYGVSFQGGVLIRPLSTYARLRVIRPCLFESTRYATFPALNPEETFKRRSLRLPEFISEKLRKLQVSS